jgi:cell division protein FtsB
MFACVLSYCLLSIVAGQAGLLAARDLGMRISSMENRIRDLESDNLALRTTMESLQFDADRMAREARDLGFVKQGETIVMLPDLHAPVVEGGWHGNLREALMQGVSSGLPDRIVKILALVIGAGIFLASWMLAFMPGRTRRGPGEDVGSEA